MPLWLSLNDRKKIHKRGRILEGGGIILAGQNIYTPAEHILGKSYGN